MTERRHLSISTWLSQLAIAILVAGLGYLIDDKLRHIDRQLDSIEDKVTGLPSIQHDVAVLWRRAFGGS